MDLEGISQTRTRHEDVRVLEVGQRVGLDGVDLEGISQSRTRHKDARVLEVSQRMGLDGVDLEGISQSRTTHEDARVLEVGQRVSFANVTVLRNHMLDIDQRVNFANVRIHLKMMFVHLQSADLVKRILRGEMSQVDDCLADVTFLQKMMDVRLERVATKRIPQYPLSQVDEQGKLEIGQTVGLGNVTILQ